MFQNHHICYKSQYPFSTAIEPPTVGMEPHPPIQAEGAAAVGVVVPEGLVQYPEVRDGVTARAVVITTGREEAAANSTILTIPCSSRCTMEGARARPDTITPTRLGTSPGRGAGTRTEGRG